MSEHKEPIPSMIYNSAVGGHVTTSQQIIDEGLNKEQSVLNVEQQELNKGILEEKTYTSGSDNGMGRVVLRKNLVEGVNTLTQNMINKSNTIYVIQYDFTLGENITIPANCILEFDGGSISSGVITCNNTTIIGAGLDKSVTLAGTLKGNFTRLDWWKYDLSASVTLFFQAALDSSITTGTTLFVPNGTYLLTHEGGDNCINTTHSVRIEGESQEGTIVKTVKSDLSNPDGSGNGYRGFLYVLCKEENLAINLHNITLDGGHTEKMYGNTNLYHKCVCILHTNEEYLLYNLMKFNASNVKVTNFEGEAFYTAAIPVGDNTRAKNDYLVEDCKFINVGGSSGNLGANVTYRNCLFDGANIEAAAGWPKLPYTFVADRCTFLNKPSILTLDNQGIPETLEDINDRTCIIKNCLFKFDKEFAYGTTHGFYAVGLSKIQHVIIEGCTFINAGLNGANGNGSILLLDNLFERAIIRNNTFITTFPDGLASIRQNGSMYSEDTVHCENNTVLGYKLELPYIGGWDNVDIDINLFNIRYLGGRTIINNSHRVIYKFKLTIENVSDEAFNMTYLNPIVGALPGRTLAAGETFIQEGYTNGDLTLGFGGLTEENENNLRAKLFATRLEYPVLSGATSGRPAIVGFAGLPYFDTDLNKIIYSKGFSNSTLVTEWVDATGAPV